LPAELSEFIHAWGDEWEVTRVSDGNSAVAELASHPIDALIVAPHVVGLPPTMLLLQARTLRPEAIRIALVSEQNAGRRLGPPDRPGTPLPALPACSRSPARGPEQH
jgi:hypothetical protein